MRTGRGGIMKLDRLVRVALLIAAGITGAALMRVHSESAPGPTNPKGHEPDSASAAAPTASAAALDTLIETERAFSALSTLSGMKDAFLYYLGRDGLVFRRGFVNGRKSWEARGNPAGTLTWAPEFAEVAG